MTWNIYGKSYDLTDFINEHPGGSFILESTKNHPDITPLFESYHAFHRDIDNIKKRLEKYEIKKDITTKVHDYTSYRELTNLVKEKFPDRNSIKINSVGIIKNMFLTTVYTYLMYFLLVTNLNLYLKLQVSFIMGIFDSSLLSFNITHDGSHYAISTNPLINNYLCKIASSFHLWNHKVWNQHHVIQHHSVTGLEDDPDKELYNFKYKFLSFFAMMIFPGQDFGQMLFYIANIYKTVYKTNYDSLDILIMSLKIYFFYCIGIWSTLSFLISTNICYFTNVFPNHSLYETKITNKYEGDDWLRLQIHNSGNFVNNNKIWTMMFGGINYQIEHHLFPSISSIHLPKISFIVRKYCEEHNIPYVNKETLYDTFYSFWKYLIHQQLYNKKLYKVE